MKTFYRGSIVFTSLALVLLSTGCPEVLDDGGISSGVPAPCSSEDPCPDGIECVFQNEGGETGFCDVDEMIAP